MPAQAMFKRQMRADNMFLGHIKPPESSVWSIIHPPVSVEILNFKPPFEASRKTQIQGGVRVIGKILIMTHHRPEGKGPPPVFFSFEAY